MCVRFVCPTGRTKEKPLRKNTIIIASSTLYVHIHYGSLQAQPCASSRREDVTDIDQSNSRQQQQQQQ